MLVVVTVQDGNLPQGSNHYQVQLKCSVHGEGGKHSIVYIFWVEVSFSRNCKKCKNNSIVLRMNMARATPGMAQMGPGQEMSETEPRSKKCLTQNQKQ